MALTTYDHRRLGEDFAGVLETATVGLESVDASGDGPERAVAVVAVDQVITAVDAPVRTERNRLRMELVRPDDTWLVARVERL